MNRKMQNVIIAFKAICNELQNTASHLLYWKVALKEAQLLSVTGSTGHLGGKY